MTSSFRNPGAKSTSTTSAPPATSHRFGDPKPLSIRPWRLYVGDHGAATGQLGLIDDPVTSFRFLMVLDRSVLGPGVEVKVKKLTVVYDS